jgi:predicted ATPase/KaiC/GvpD/RAD55 family RecA-like ATPase
MERSFLASLEHGRVPSSRPIAAKEVPLVDRTEEMNVLKEAVYRAVHGEGGLVLLHGEAGIGKTRLARELGAYARSRGVQVLYGRCPALFRMDGVPPYILWKEVVKDYLETCTPEKLYRVIGDQPLEVSKLVPEIKKVLKTIPESFELSPEHSRDRLFEAVSQFITNISRETPLLVILDDLQWTDESSLLLMHYLTRGVYKESLLLLGAFRDTDVDDRHPLSAVLAELNRERLLQSVQLKRMSFDDVSELIKQILEQDDVSTEFCELVYEKTRGNPFFAEEVIKSLKEEEVIYREDNRWRIKEVAQIEFPETVKSVIKKRISRLDDECQSILTFASFVGNDFTFEALCGVSGIEENKLLELMEKVIKTGLVKERVVRGEDVYCFADVIVRDVVHEEVSHLKHKKLHDKVGCSLEKVYAEKIDEHLGELAYHFLESGDKEKALDYFLKAGDKAMKVYANNEVISYYQSALKLLEGKEERLQERAQVLGKLGDVKSIVGGYNDSLKYWNEALLLSQRLSEKEKAAGLHVKMASILWRDLGASEESMEHLDEATRILEEMPESAELAHVFSVRAQSLWHDGNPAGTLSWAEKALELSKKLGAFDVVAESYTNLALALTSTGKREEAIECLEKALKMALDNGYFETAMRIYNNLAASLPIINEKRLEYCEKGYELAKKVGCIGWIAWLGNTLAYSYANMGNMSKAFQLVEEAVALNRKTGSLTDLHYAMSALGLGYRVTGEWDKSEQCYEEAMAIAKTLNRLPSIGGTAYNLAALHFEKEEYTKARELFEKANEISEKAGDKGWQMVIYEELIRTYVELGETEKAGNLLESLEKFALETKDDQRVANKDALRALLFRAQKRWDESVAFFEKSLREFEDLGARRWNIYVFARSVLYEYARVFIERDQNGDKEKARDLLNQALEIFQKMGAKKNIEKVEAKLLYIETGKAALVPKPAELVATGYADLDKLLCGGLRSSSAVVLTSPSCNERESLIESFLKTGREKGEVTFYLTTTARAARAFMEEPQSDSYLFVCNPQADAIAESSPNVFKMKGVENLTEINIALTSTIHKLNASLKGSRRACIDIVSDALLQHHAVQTRKWLTALTTELTSKGFTILAVVDPQMHSPEELHAILGLFDGEINVYEKGTEKSLRIKRMSNQEYLEDELLLAKESLRK